MRRLAQYRVGGDGATALKTLNIYIKNLIAKPDEIAKYGVINSQNEKFKARVGRLVGGVALLLALGFVKAEDGMLRMAPEARDEALLKEAQAKVQAALASLQ